MTGILAGLYMNMTETDCLGPDLTTFKKLSNLSGTRLKSF